MPSLIRFLIVVGVLSAVIFGGLYVAAIHFEPAQKDVSSPVPEVSLRRE